jgi:hypothetical protein
MEPAPEKRLPINRPEICGLPGQPRHSRCPTYVAKGRPAHDGPSRVRVPALGPSRGKHRDPKALATITWSLPVGEARGRLRLAGTVIRSPKEAFWSLDDAKDMAVAAARAWRQSPCSREVEG